MIRGILTTLKDLLGLGGKLPAFGAEIGRQEIAGKTVRIPYQQTISFFDYAAPERPADEIVDGRKVWYLYLWVPVVAPEIGVRMMSPVGDLAKPREGDILGDDWHRAAGDADSWFDTWIFLERAEGLLDPATIGDRLDSLEWTRYGQNDDSTELPPVPSGAHYNSLLRAVTDPSEPSKAIVRGLYRIGFGTYKTGDVRGSFLAQIGAPVGLPGCVIDRDPHRLARQATDFDMRARAAAERAKDHTPATRTA